MKVFIAGPLFSQAEREFNLKVDEILRKHGFRTTLPQRDIGKLWEELGRGKKAYRRIYEEDLKELEGCDAVVAVLDGNDVDSGTAFEVGYACAKGKPVIGLKTDTRVFAEGEVLNNMLAQSVIAIAKRPEDLISILKKLEVSPKTCGRTPRRGGRA
jgi:nucleoside 2-deoxyribosyltransferase